MSQNNTIRKSDKKFIRTEKARIRAQFLDAKKQEELISGLYAKFLVVPKSHEAKPEQPKKEEVKREAKVSKVKAESKKKVTAKK